eukprot:gnl/TRDRNA2_/TRDRNA2_180671_c0_seq1.p1 gnl/TRDRNA2_/TRDRNA2_180671_c0~~gnl/TRDRNA2_/TRDRNA2_180671_c0_seq1.p1  ORF type:complete len:242 (-),score=45.22 gnl/TRDRNA2_/TRDRNA2_180671_c0_seq1:147-872(-)
MLFSPEMFLPVGPPPQAVLNQRPGWIFLIFLLGVTLMMRMVCLDVVGGLLCALLLCLSVVIIRDGMRELSKFSLLFGMICGINLVFYLVPLLSAVIGGRSERRVMPVESVSYQNTQQLTYTLTVKTTPFFDKSLGLMYNMQSAGMIMMPLCMLIGTYLGITAHQEIQRLAASLVDDGEFGFGVGGYGGLADSENGTPVAGPAATTTATPAETRTPGVAASGPPRRSLAASFAAFQGASHKL